MRYPYLKPRDEPSLQRDMPFLHSPCSSMKEAHRHDDGHGGDGGDGGLQSIPGLKCAFAASRRVVFRGHE
jgi:hypothetical protein